MNAIRHWEDPVTALIGLQLVTAPWLLDYQGDPAATADAWLAGATLTLAGSLGWRRYRAWREWVAAATALWLLAAPLLLRFDNVRVAALNAAIAGGAVLLLSIWALLGKDRRDEAWSKSNVG